MRAHRGHFGSRCCFLPARPPPKATQSGCHHTVPPFLLTRSPGPVLRLLFLVGERVRVHKLPQHVPRCRAEHRPAVTPAALHAFRVRASLPQAAFPAGQAKGTPPRQVHRRLRRSWCPAPSTTRVTRHLHVHGAGLNSPRSCFV